MRIFIFITSLFTLNIVGFTQSTEIPDSNFEQELIDQGFDDVLDGLVLTESIDTITYLAVAGAGITDLTGIADFTSLLQLNCVNNDLITLDMSGNTSLEALVCAGNDLASINLSGCSNLQALIASSNELTSLDISENTELQTLLISSNNLSTLDLSENVNLVLIICSHNSIGSLDLSNLSELIILNCNTNNLEMLDLSANELLTDINCEENELIYINLQNGNNTAICSDCFTSLNNPDLNCVEVDDPAFSEENWANRDEHTDFKENCGLSVDETDDVQVTIYPNPTSEQLFIEINSPGIGYELYSISGELILSGTFVLGLNTLQLNELVPGLYFINMEGDTIHSTKKVIVK